MDKPVTRTVLIIMGMRDNACRERIAKLLAAIDGVQEVDINLHRARARVLHTPPCQPADLVWSIVQAGYGASLPH
jgi:copper chaperone CopZ